MPASSQSPEGAPSRPSQGSLTDHQREVLEFERLWWKHAGVKEEAIRSTFGLSAARYYQVLNATLDTPSAMMFDPMLVKRLQRLRDARTEARSRRILGTFDQRSGPE